MTTPTNPDLLEQIAASPVPFDLYREVHKGLRHALFEVTSAAGAADCGDPIDRDAVATKVLSVTALLHAHHGHENRFIQPLLVAKAPRLAAIVESTHDEIDADIADLEVRAEKLTGSAGGGAVACGLDLYRRLALFTATYLAHMAHEEGEVMTALRSSTTPAELVALEMDLRASVPPPLMCRFIAVMVPAMDAGERAAMLGGMKAGAPAEVFELFRAATEAALDPADYRSLAGRIGLA